MRWQHEQGLAFEVARECMTDWIAILVSRLEAAAPAGSAEHELLRREVLSASAERRDLRLDDVEAVASAKAKYGDLVRQFRESQQGH